MKLKPSHGAILFAVGTVLAADGLPALLRAFLSVQISDGWGSIIGGFLGAVAVGLAAFTGFSAQRHQMALQEKAEQSRRDTAQCDLSAVLRSELEVCEFEINVYIATLKRETEKGVGGANVMSWPHLPVMIYQANLDKISILPDPVSSTVIGVYHRICRMIDLGKEVRFSIVDMQRRIRMVEVQRDIVRNAINLLNCFEKKADGTYSVPDFSIFPVDLFNSDFSNVK